MADTITIPTAESLAKKISHLQAELRALRRLYRLARAAEAAKQTTDPANAH